MAKINYYAVHNGRQPGIYKTWADCKAQVNKFSGAVYKGFATLEEAQYFLEYGVAPNETVKVTAKSTSSSFKEITSKTSGQALVSSQEQATKTTKATKTTASKTAIIKATINKTTKIAKSGESVDNINQRIVEEIAQLQAGEAIAFVDGSFDKRMKGVYSFGMVLLVKGEGLEVIEDAQAIYNPDYATSHNVAGEIAGISEALTRAVQKKCKHIKVFYDYEGIEKWATRKWKTNKTLTQNYVEFFDKITQHIAVSFEHVSAHVGIEFNERADQLAKQAIQDYKLSE